MSNTTRDDIVAEDNPGILDAHLDGRHVSRDRHWITTCPLCKITHQERQDLIAFLGTEEAEESLSEALAQAQYRNLSPWALARVAEDWMKGLLA